MSKSRQLAKLQEGYPPTPNLDKMVEAKDRLGTEHVGAFLEWLSSNGMSVCETFNGDSSEGIEEGAYLPISAGVEGLLARYADVNLDNCEHERVAVLAWVRKNPTGRFVATPSPPVQNIPPPQTEEGDKARAALAALRAEEALQRGSLDRLRALTDDESVARDEALTLVLRLLQNKADSAEKKPGFTIELAGKFWSPEDVLRLIEIIAEDSVEYRIDYHNFSAKKFTPKDGTTFLAAVAFAQEKVNRAITRWMIATTARRDVKPTNRPFAVVSRWVTVAIIQKDEDA